MLFFCVWSWVKKNRENWGETINIKKYLVLRIQKTKWWQNWGTCKIILFYLFATTIIIRQLIQPAHYEAHYEAHRMYVVFEVFCKKAQIQRFREMNAVEIRNHGLLLFYYIIVSAWSKVFQFWVRSRKRARRRRGYECKLQCWYLHENEKEERQK